LYPYTLLFAVIGAVWSLQLARRDSGSKNA
jgi:hypothetical protein